MADAAWLVPLGFAAGMLGSMVGLGGGVVIVPVLTLLGAPPAQAAGSSMLAVLSNAAASTLVYSRRGLGDARAGLALGAMSLPGVAAGAYASGAVGRAEFMALFGALLVASAAYLLARRGLRPARAPRLAVALLAAGASLLAGTASSFFGVGGGAVLVPFMVACMGMTVARAAPASQVALLVASSAGAAAHGALGHPDLLQASLLAAGAFAGGAAGAALAPRVGEGALRVVASAALLAAAARMLLGWAQEG